MQTGIEDLIKHPSSMDIIIVSIMSPNLPTRTHSLDFLLGVVTLEYPVGHDLVINAFKSLMGDRKKFPNLFTPLIDAINECASQQGILGTQVRKNLPRGSSVTLFAAEKGVDKQGGILQKEISAFLVSSYFLKQ
jgi:hypothetical protein